jgi:hypothetical protein
MTTLEMKCEQIPVSQGKIITLESAHITIQNFGTMKFSGPFLIHTNVIKLNANGLCAFCLEQRIIGVGWEEFEGHPDGSLTECPFSRFLVCNECKRLSRIYSILQCEGNWMIKPIFMKYALENQWYKIDSVCYWP